MYKQCTLKSGVSWHHAWIPAEFAVKGKVIQFKDENGHWGRNWEVISAGAMILISKYVRELERDHLHQRKASDI